MNALKTTILAAALAGATATASAQEFTSKAMASATAINTLKAAGAELAGKCKSGVIAFRTDPQDGKLIGLELRRLGEAWRIFDAAVSEQCSAELRVGERQ